MNQKRSPNSSDAGSAVYVSRAGWFSLTHPRDWVVEEEEDCVTISNPKTGVGALQVSAYRPPVIQDPRQILAEHLSDNQVRYESKAVAYRSDGKRAVAAYNYIHGSWYKKVWFISENQDLLLATYTCKVEDQGKELDIAEGIVESITPRDVNDRERDGVVQ